MSFASFYKHVLTSKRWIFCLFLNHQIMKSVISTQKRPTLSFASWDDITLYGCSEWAWPQKSFGGFSSNMHCTKSILLHELKMSKSSKGFLFQLIRFLSVKKMNLDEELTGKDLILAHWFRLRACLLSINKTHILISFFERYSWDESLSVWSVWVKRRVNDRHTEKETESVAGV